MSESKLKSQDNINFKRMHETLILFFKTIQQYMVVRQLIGKLAIRIHKRHLRD